MLHYKLNGSHPDVSKDRIQGLNQSNIPCIFLVVLFFYVGDMVRPRLGPHQALT